MNVSGNWRLTFLFEGRAPDPAIIGRYILTPAIFETLASISSRSWASGPVLPTTWGLGKTIQVLALLLVLHRQCDGNRQPSLSVAPASGRLARRRS